MQNDFIKVGVVILNYNTFQDTIRLVMELQSQTIVDKLQIIVVDNASPNGSYEKLKPLEDGYANTVVLQTPENLGYAKGNNVGLKYLEENTNPEYVAILNNDVQIPVDCLEKLKKRYDLLKNPAIISPKQLDSNLKEALPYRMNTYIGDCLNLFYIFKIFHKRNALKFRDDTGVSAMKVEMIPGSFMFASFEKFKAMGFFYPNTFLFVEERFIAAKAKQMGFNNYILLDLTYVHAHSKTINETFDKIDKFRLLYTGWVEFTRVYRTHGKPKALIIKYLMHISLIELYLAQKLKIFIKSTHKCLKK